MRNLLQPTNRNDSFSKPLNWCLSNYKEATSFDSAAKRITFRTVARAVGQIFITTILLPLAVLLFLIGAAIKTALPSNLEQQTSSIGENPHKRTLHVKQVSLSQKQRRKYVKIAKNWQSKASELYQISSGAAKAIYKDAAHIAGIIAECMTRKKIYGSSYDALLLAYDQPLEQEQGIALIKEKGLHNEIRVAYMTTNPMNVRSSSTQSKTTRVEGVGTKLISTIAQRALEKQRKQIYLEAIQSAIPFYKKLGFIKDRRRPEEANTQPLVLRKKKIEQLLARFKINN